MNKATMTEKDLDLLAINTIKFLSIEAVEKANSGHPGTPMGLADLSFYLWTRHLRYNPKDPNWLNRDRFVLSCGHASMLIYSLLHLAGFELSLEDLQNFRQWDSQTPGHPEYRHTPGVETTTGPLGQGISNAVGMALGAKMLAARVNTPDFSPIDHKVYVLASDGDIQEGVQAEAAALAGHWKLGNLIVFYDANRITIAGESRLSMSEDVAKRYEAYGWAVQKIDGHDPKQILAALEKAKSQTEKPNFIVTNTHIANGAPTKHDTADSHGAPLGAAEIAATKKALGWPETGSFLVPQEVRELFAKRATENQKEHEAWTRGLSAWEKKNPNQAALWNSLTKKTLPADLEKQLLDSVTGKTDATRNLSGTVIQKAAALLPGLVGGSADLEPSTKTLINQSKAVLDGDFSGRNLHFGIREHGMGAIVNGLSYYGSFFPYGSTFLVFSDYMRPSIRIAGLAKLQSTFVFTHDSIFLGEDGPTHQPVEHITALRAIPNCWVIRPADATETAMAWAMAIRRQDGPTCFALTRQKVPAITRDANFKAEMVAKGGYIVAEASGGKPQLVLIGTGSELSLCMEAKTVLEKEQITTRVVSMPCIEAFLAQTQSYRDSVLPAKGVRFAVVEAGLTWGWYRLVGKESLVIGVDRFGASAPDKVLAEKFGFTAPQVSAKILSWWKGA